MASAGPRVNCDMQMHPGEELTPDDTQQLLLQPYKLADLPLSNRVVMAPLTRGRAHNPGHVPNDLIANTMSSICSTVVLPMPRAGILMMRSRLMESDEANADGTLANGKVFFDMTSAPGEDALDGMKVDRGWATSTFQVRAGFGFCRPKASTWERIISPKHAHNLI
jgi:hypothetical protein